MSIKNIAFIGLGAMGTPMATFLLKAGYEVRGFDIVKKKMSDLVPLGLKPAKSLRECVRGADLIMLSLVRKSAFTNPWGVIQEVVEGKDGILKSLKRGQIIVNTSTVPPLETKLMAQRLAKNGVEWMDVPVSGAAFQAREGNMVFMAGGKKSVFNKVKPVLDKVGKKTLYVGKSGDGARLKLVVNQVLFMNQGAAIEGLAHGLKAGLDPEVMYDVLVAGAAGSNLIAARGKAMLADEFGKYGTTWGALKDLRLALESARELGVMLPMAALYNQIMLQTCYSGWGDGDAIVVLKLYEHLAGIAKKGAKVDTSLPGQEKKNREIKNISVIGLGAMGTPITTFLLKAGYPVTGFDLLEERMSHLAGMGLKPVNSAREAAQVADLILLSLPNWAAVRDVVEGEGGLWGALQPGQIIVDTSTVPPWETKIMAEKLGPKGIAWMDVPISGSSAQARVGNMVFMVGGDKSVYKIIKPVLDKVGKKTVYVGPNSHAATLKLVVNQVLFLNQASAVEGFVHGLKAGLNPDVMLDVLVSGAAGSDLMAARGKDMLAGNFSIKGPLGLSIKDIEIILESAKRLGVMVPLTVLYHQLMLQAHYNGCDDSDATVVMKVYEQLAGIKR
jgi:3-hydroxyisobutyrate dehydrogenase-like beta-hydroxyacid dehydrogenase